MKEYQQELIQIKKILKNNPKGLTIIEIAEKLGVNRNSVAKYLDVLNISGEVEQRNIGKAKLFTLSNNVPVSALLNFSRDGILLLDRALEVVQANDKFLEEAEVKRDSIFQKNIEKLSIPLLSETKILPTIKKVLMEEISEKEVEVQEGEKYYRAKIIPTTFEDGGGGITLILEDITARKKAEKKLRKSEQNYREIFDKAGDAIFVHDPKTAEILDVNKEACKTYNYSYHELKNLTIGDLSAGEEPYTMAHAQDLVKKVQEEGPHTFEWRAKKKDGSFFWVEVTLKSALISGKERILAIVRDINKRKKVEQKLWHNKKKYRSIVNNSLTGVFIIDNNYTLDFVNKKLCQMLGYSPDELLGEDFRDFLSEDDKETVVERYLKRQDGEEMPSTYNLEVIQKNGEEKEVKISPMAMENEQGKVQTIAQVIES